MTSPTEFGSTSPRISAADWDKLRQDFQRSMLVETALRSLAENIDGGHWPSDDPYETPACFVDLNRNEALARLASQGMNAAKLDLLADILRGTLAFDTSFGDMLEIARKAETEHSILHRNLDRLGIPREFPARLCSFSPGTHQFCSREGVSTVQEFASFKQNAADDVVIADEFRDLLNALVHVDEQAIARFLPYRPKTSGVYFVEAIGLIVRSLPAEGRARLAQHPASLAPERHARLLDYADYFAEQTNRIRTAHAAGTPLDRLVAPIDDLSLEPAVAALLGLVLHPPKPQPAAPAPATRQEKPVGPLLRFIRKFRV